jgi:hypothetical protein
MIDKLSNRPVRDSFSQNEVTEFYNLIQCFIYLFIYLLFI